MSRTATNRNPTPVNIEATVSYSGALNPEQGDQGAYRSTPGEGSRIRIKRLLTSFKPDASIIMEETSFGSKPCHGTEIYNGPETSARPEIQPAPETSSRPETQPEPETSSRPETQPGQETSYRPEIRPGPETSSRPEIRPGTETGSRPETQSGPETSSRPEAQLGPDIGFKPENLGQKNVVAMNEETCGNGNGSLDKEDKGLQVQVDYCDFRGEDRGKFFSPVEV